jgi:hypothetical protein
MNGKQLLVHQEMPLGIFLITDSICPDLWWMQAFIYQNATNTKFESYSLSVPHNSTGISLSLDVYCLIKTRDF